MNCTVNEQIGYLKECLDDPQVSKYSPDEGFLDVREAVRCFREFPL